MNSSISTVYLYSNSTSKILLYPFTSQSASIPKEFTHALLRRGLVKVDYPVGAITIKLGHRAWGYQTSQSGVYSRLAALDLVRAIHAAGHTLHCCADLSRLGQSAAGCLIVSHGITPSALPVEFACISFHATDTIRLISVPDHERQTFPSVLRQSGFTRVTGRVECPDYRKSHGSVWCAQGVNTVHARLVVLDILKHMVEFGWSGCIPLKVSSSDSDLDTIVFMKSKEQKTVQRKMEMMCISLHKLDTFRLIMGANNHAGTTASTLRGAITSAWPLRIRSVGKYDASEQYVLNGIPWHAHTTVQTIESRRLVCSVLESMQRIGWKLYAALDLSKKVTDKSSFFFVRQSGMPAEVVGCISLTDANKVQLVNLPSKIVDRTMALVRSGSLGDLADSPIRYDSGTASFKLRNRQWDRSRTSAEIKAASVLITRILQAAFDGGGRLLCSADVSAKTYNTGGENSQTFSADLSSFFFAFSGGE